MPFYSLHNFPVFHLQSVSSTCSGGFVTCVLKVPLARLFGQHGISSGLGNSQKAYYKTYRNKLPRNTLYVGAHSVLYSFFHRLSATSARPTVGRSGATAVSSRPPSQPPPLRGIMMEFTLKGFRCRNYETDCMTYLLSLTIFWLLWFLHVLVSFLVIK